MFRLWCKLFDDSNHLLKDMVVENDDAATNRTRKIFDGIHSACRFYQDNFIDSIDFSYMEIQVIEED